MFKNWKLHHWIITGLILGVVTGIILQEWVPPGTSTVPDSYAFIMKVLNFCGQVFMRLLQMIIIPLVVGSIIVGTAGLGDLKSVGRLGARLLIYYTLTTALAVCIGLAWVTTVRPGSFMPAETRDQLMASMVAPGDSISAPAPPKLDEMLLNMFPKNPFSAAVNGDILALIVFSLFFGIGITAIVPNKARIMVDFFDSVTDVVVAMVEWIMKLAPVAVWALMAAVVAKTGIAVLKPLGVFAIVVILALLTQLVLTYSFSLYFLSRVNPLEFFPRITQALLVAFSTSSSSATLPVTMKVAEKDLGIPEKVGGFVLPLGATINMDGTALYQGIVTVFLAQLFGLPLTFIDQLTIVLTATLASIGAAGVPGAGLITLLVVLQSVGINPEGVAIVLGVDRILDMCRTAVNVSGDLTAARYIYTVETRSEQPVFAGSEESG